MVMLLWKLNDEDFDICRHFLPEIDKEDSYSYKELKKMKEILIIINNKLKKEKSENISNNRLKTLLKSS